MVYSYRNHVRMAKEGREILARKRLPDYLIIVNERNIIPKLLDEADRAGVKTILFNEGLIFDDYKRFKSGQWPLKHFIGQVLPDDYQSGKLLAKALLTKAIKEKKQGPDNKIHMLGINGSRNTASPILRGKGLQDTVSETEDVVLHQVVHAYWDREEARTISRSLLKRYPNISVIWSASDLMALGTAEGIEDSGMIPGKDILTGGIDWAPFVFDKVQEKRISASVGGHIFDGAWAMVMIYDHFHKVFTAFQSKKTQFFLITPENVDNYKKIYTPSVWEKIIFKKFTKFENPGIQDYNFGVGLILEGGFQTL